MKSSLNHIFFFNHHVISKVVETKLVVCCINNIAVISLTSFVCVHFVKNYANCKTEEFINLSHCFGVTFCKVIVYRYNVYAFAVKGIKVCRKCSYKGFTFTCFHFRNSSLMKNNAADKLYTEMAHTHNSPCCFPYCCVCFGKKAVESFSVFISFFKFNCFGFKLVICKSFVSLLIAFYLIYYGGYLFNFLFAVISENLFQKTHFCFTSYFL